MEIPVISLDDLVQVKKASGRQQDLRDLDSLGKIPGKVRREIKITTEKPLFIRRNSHSKPGKGFDYHVSQEQIRGIFNLALFPSAGVAARRQSVEAGAAPQDSRNPGLIRRGNYNPTGFQV